MLLGLCLCFFRKNEKREGGRDQTVCWRGGGGENFEDGRLVSSNTIILRRSV